MDSCAHVAPIFKVLCRCRHVVGSQLHQWAKFSRIGDTTGHNVKPCNSAHFHLFEVQQNYFPPKVTEQETLQNVRH